MINTMLIERMKTEDLSNEFLAEICVEVLKEEPFGSVVIPYDDTDDFDLTDLRYKIKKAVRDEFLLPSYSSAQTLVKVNNIACVYDCDSKTAWDILNFRFDNSEDNRGNS